MNNLNLSWETFDRIFPFFLKIDNQLRIMDVGRSMQKVLGQWQNTALFEHFQIERPHTSTYSFDFFRDASEEIFILQLKNKAFRFRGQWIAPVDNGNLLFLGSPWIQHVEEMKERKLHLSDFAIHDPSFDLLHIIKTIEINSEEIKILMARLQEKSNLLKESEERYKSTLNAASDVIYKMDKDGHLTYANPAAERLTGYTLDELLRKNLIQLVAKSERDAVGALFIQQIESDVNSNYLEFPIVRKDGTTKWIGQSTQLQIVNGVPEFVALALDITQKKEATFELEQTNQKLHLLQLLFDNSSDAIQIADESGQLYYINQTASDRLGIRKDECRNYNVSHFEILFQDIDNWHAHLRELEKHDKMTIEGQNINQKTGQQFPVEVTVTLYEINDKKYVIANSRDITDRKENERILQQELRLQEMLIDMASTYIGLDIHQVEATINLSLERMGKFVNADRAYVFDYNFDDDTTSNTYEWCNTGIEPEKDNLQRVPLKMFPQWVERHRNGLPFHIPDVHAMNDWEESGLRAILEPQGIKSLIAIPLFDEKELIGFVGFDAVKQHHVYNDKETKLLFLFGQMLINIRNRQKWERQLTLQEEKFRNIIAHMNLGLIEVDNDDRILFANQSFCEMSGYEIDELKGQIASNLLTLNEQRSSIKTKQALREQGITDSYEMQILNKSREERWWLISGAPNFDDRNQMIGTIGIHLDITEQKMLERELAASKSVAEAASKAKEIFLANMSHEIRTPLNVIIGMIRQLNRVELNLEQVYYVHQAGASAKHLLTIINNVLDMAKIDSGELKVQLEPFNLHQLAEHVHNIMEAQASEKNLQFTMALGPNIVPVLIGDETRLRQILINLIGNAIKFTNQGQVNLSIGLREEWDVYQKIVFKVTDTGVGMSPEFITRIFDKFSQEQNASNRGFEGTGLGMAISNDLVKLMGGKMAVDSIKGIGTTIQFEIDFEVSNHVMPQTWVKQIQQNDCAGKRVLLVEDNEMNRFIARQSLAFLGFEIDEAENGQIAVDLVQLVKYDLVLMDIQMPVMDGVEATQKIRHELHSNMPIIALTANAIKQDIDLYLSIGMNDFVTKPYEEADLFLKIQNALGIDGESKGSPHDKLDATSDRLYSLDFIEKLSRGNSQIVNEMKSLFIQMAVSHELKLKQALELGDYIEISKLAHQMKPSLEQMKVQSIMEDVRLLERLKTETFPHNDVEPAVLRVLDTLKQLAVDLKTS